MDRENQRNALVLFVLCFSSLVLMKFILPVFEIDPKRLERFYWAIDAILITTTVISLIVLVVFIIFMLLHLLFRR